MATHELRPQFGAAVARTYDAGRSLPNEVLDEVLSRLVSVAVLEPGAALLDAGAGTGALAAPFLRGGYRYIGLDRSAEMLGEFGSSEAELVQADLLALPLRDASFDVVLVFRVFGVVPGWRRGIRECLRVLRPGGHLLAGRVMRDPGSLSAFIRDERHRLLQDSTIATERPGASDDAVISALSASAVPAGELEPLRWIVRTTPRRLIEQNLSGWRVAQLSDTDRSRIEEGLCRAITARAGELDNTWEEPSTLALSLFWKPSP